MQQYAECWLLSCVKGGESEQYFILLFSFQVDFITLSGTVLTAVTLYCSHELHFSGSETPFSLCCLPTTWQKSTLGCWERLARAKDRKMARWDRECQAQSWELKVCVCNVSVVCRIIHAPAPQLEIEGGENKMFKTDLDDFSGGVYKCTNHHQWE